MFMGTEKFFYWAYRIIVGCQQLGHRQEGRGETILIGLKNSFGSIKLKCRPLGICENLDHSVHNWAFRALELCALNPTDTSWSPFHYYVCHHEKLCTCVSLIHYCPFSTVQVYIYMKESETSEEKMW